jgi:hypothetical protein
MNDKMKDDLKRMPASDFVDSLLQLIYEAVAVDAEARKEALEDFGVDASKIKERVRRRITALNRQHRLEQAHVLRERLIAVVSAYKQNTVDSPKEFLVSKLKELFGPSSNAPAFSSFFHKLESLNEDDIRGMIDETEILKILRQELKKEKE